MKFLLASLAWILVLSGLAGSILPLLPGIPLIWLGILIVGWASGFTALSGTTIIVLGIVTLFAQSLSYISGVLGAKTFGATTMGTVGSFVGMIMGLLFLGGIGVIIGPFVGAIFGELLAGRSEQKALRASFGTLIGFFGGTFIQVLVAFVLFGFFVIGFLRFL
ncbi:MAG: DUF456 domain-containing protein [Candidatus Kerfeldbacteria bacterium]|nr:DUF456 domain-containing protein [Candidatus Kerfeldbacteria bacterium]